MRLCVRILHVEHRVWALLLRSGGRTERRRVLAPPPPPVTRRRCRDARPTGCVLFCCVTPASPSSARARRRRRRRQAADGADGRRRRVRGGVSVCFRERRRRKAPALPHWPAAPRESRFNSCYSNDSPARSEERAPSKFLASLRETPSLLKSPIPALCHPSKRITH